GPTGDEDERPAVACEPAGERLAVTARRAGDQANILCHVDDLRPEPAASLARAASHRQPAREAPSKPLACPSSRRTSSAPRSASWPSTTGWSGCASASRA